MKWLALVLLLTGCPVLSPLEKPKVTIDSVAVGSVTFGGIDGRVDMSIVNPNAVSIPLRTFDWQLSVAGTPAVTGHTDLAATIPAKGTAPVQSDIHIGAADAVNVASHVAAGETTYRLTGTLHFATSLGDLAVAFTQDGELTSL